MKKQNRDLIHTQAEKDKEIEKLKSELQRLKAQVANQQQQIAILDKLVNAPQANMGVPVEAELSGMLTSLYDLT